MERYENLEIKGSLKRASRRTVLVRTARTDRLIKGYEAPIGVSKKPCSRCSFRGGSKWEVSFASNEGMGASKDRYCIKCRKVMVIPFDADLYDQFGQPEGKKAPKRPSYKHEDTPGLYHPEQDWAAIADKETPGWRE